MILDDEYAHAFAKLVKLKNSRREEDQWSSTRTHIDAGQCLEGSNFTGTICQCLLLANNQDDNLSLHSSMSYLLSSVC
jgi:hypothetical protein